MKKNNQPERPAIEAEVIPSQAVARQEPQTVAPHYEPLTPPQMRARLDLVRNVMKEAMMEGQDYGKIPGCGDKPGLFQPGAQKLSMMFQLNPEVREEVITDYQNYNRGYRFVIRVSNGDKFAEGVGECSTLETKYRYRQSGRKCPECGKETIIKGKAEYGGGYLCFQKKGGCGWKCADGSQAATALLSQNTERVENDNAPDFWNTVRKMSYKRGFVHAIINATNTSELWSQDLEDLAANGVVGSPASKPKDDDDGDLGPQKASGASRGQRGPTPNDTTKDAPTASGGAANEPAKDATTRKTLLQILRKRIGNERGTEADICRFFQNVPSQSKKWKGELMLGVGVDGTLERMKLDKLEYAVQKFDNWFPVCEEWCKTHPVR